VFKRSAVILETFDRGQGAPYSAKGVEIWWTIDSILIPSALKDHKAEIGDIPAYKIARSITKNSGGQYASVLDSEAGKALYAIYPSLREAVGPEMADQLLNGGRN
jgi:hypothetical protein